MKASWMSLTLILVCGGPVLAKTELELLRERRAELDRKIQQLEQQEKLAQETVPAKSPSPTDTTPAATPAKEERIYVVRKGDTLERISRKTRVSVATLEQLNRLKSSTVIHIGQKLKLPPAAPAKPKETVVPAGTPTTTKTVSNPAPTASPPANSPRPKTTSKSEPKSETKTTAPKLEAGNEKLVIHSITLQNRVVYSDVAAKYGTTTDRLNDLNGLSLSPKQLLQEGTELYVPVPAQP